MHHRIKRILLGLGPSQKATPAEAFAIGFASRFGAGLTVHALCAPFWIPYGAGDVFPAEFAESENERRMKEAETTVSRVQSAASEANVSNTAEMPRVNPQQPIGAEMARLARVHDLTIFNASSRDSQDLRYVLEDVLFDSGRPAIVVPSAGGEVDPDHIAIAWDGSARAARAVKDALPLLQAARRVSVVTVSGEKDLSRLASAADLGGYLASHEVDATMVALTATGAKASARIREFAVEEGVGMIVMGAFVHSRFRQAILGGVTSSLLEDSPVPLFMAY